MRRILVENSRRKQRQKNGGGLKRVNLEVAATCAPSDDIDDLLALDEALTALNTVFCEDRKSVV